MDEEYEEAGNKTPEASVEDYYDQQYTTFMKVGVRTAKKRLITE